MVREKQYKEKENSMNELNCKKCNTPTTCDEEAVAITCSMCTMNNVFSLLDGIDNPDIVGIA